jgi:hypothetical protein
MDCYRLVEILLGSTHIYSNRHNLNHFIRRLTYAVTAKYFFFSIFLYLTHQLKQCSHLLRIILSQGIEHVDKLRLIDFNLIFSKFGNSLSFGQANDTNRGMRKYDSGNAIIVHFKVSSIVEDSLSYYSTCFHSDRSELYVVGCVSYGIDSWYISVLVIVYGYPTVGI